MADRLTLAAIATFSVLSVLTAISVFSPEIWAVIETNAFSKFIVENTTVKARTYNDYVGISGLHDLHVTGNPGTRSIAVHRDSLNGGEASYFDTTGTTISIAAASDGSTNMVKVAPVTNFTAFHNFDNGGADNGRIRYTGAFPDTFHIAITISVASTGPNDSFVYGVAKNGVVMPTSKVIQKITTAGDTKSTALHVATTLNQNDYVELYVGNLDDADDAIVKTVNIFALGM